ncbi:16S rRNA (guanine1207-N2)-methyltransferase [Conyzicola lurida]|uniref:16S rRNA (Guanine1207-N2)-methyltransferase n=1 Tax=Conyzicola lurida TaxID=1172621 RepID=A0A841ALZ7_9MICO|nr:16S rRNA (guanine1207-N2)-methyltransferase [Conyzicola lurida]
MSDFDFEVLRRYPDVEAPNLFAYDPSDRLILAEAAEALAAAAPGQVTVIGDSYGALTIGAAHAHGLTGIRVHQDALSGELALGFNAREENLGDAYENHALDESLLSGATVVLLQLPRSLEELDDIANAIARFADPSVVVYSAGRIKHMTLGMNEVLARYFGRVDVTRAQQKSRGLIAREPRETEAPARRKQFHSDLGLWVVATGSVFAGTKVDIGTRALLAVLDQVDPNATTAIDLGAGTGILAATLAKTRPGLRVIATDQSASAVASATATMEANDLQSQVTVVRDDGLSSQPDESADVIVVNPPFHIGGAVHAGAAINLLSDVYRVLKPGGQLWAVYNTHLAYRAEMGRMVGPTTPISRNDKFTVTLAEKPLTET